MNKLHSLEPSLAALKKATSAFEAAVNPPPANDRERDGAIQRFEFTFELAWKTGKKVLKSLGIEETSPREVIRELATQRLISSAEIWILFLNLRNISSHIYNESQANEVFEKSKTLLPEVKLLLQNIETRLKTLS